MHLQPSRHPVTVYQSSLQSFITIATNTEEIWPRLSPGEKACPRADGWWGPHEYAVLPQPFDWSSPYLAWIPSLKAYDDPQFDRRSGVDPTIIHLDFNKYPLIRVSGFYDSVPPTPKTPSLRHPSLPSKPRHSIADAAILDFCTASDAMTRIVKTQVDNLIDRVRVLITQARNDLDTRSVRLPEQALFYLKQARYWNSLPGTNTECGHRLILAGMKRAAMELHGFILWRHDQQLLVDEGLTSAQKHRTLFRARGALVDNEDDYAFLAKRGIPVWMKIPANAFEPPPSARLVSFTTIPIHRDPMFPPGHKSGHHTALFFYPPIVDDTSSFELAARGYAGRLDIYQPNAQIADVHQRMHSDRGTFQLHQRRCTKHANRVLLL